MIRRFVVFLFGRSDVDNWSQGVREFESLRDNLARIMSSVDCPFCGRDMVSNKCPGCGHDPSSRHPTGSSGIVVER